MKDFQSQGQQADQYVPSSEEHCMKCDSDRRHKVQKQRMKSNPLELHVLKLQ